MIMKHFYGSFELSVLYFCLSNVKCSTIFVYENLLESLFGLCCRGDLYTQIITHIITLFLCVFQDFVHYIVSFIALTCLHTVVFFSYRIFQTVFSGQWISKYVRLMSIKISIYLFLSHCSEYVNILIKVQCSSEAVHMHARKHGITLDNLMWEYLIILFGL
jgi:hypothetical protein